MITYWNTFSMLMRQRQISMPALTEFCSLESSTCIWTPRIYRSLKKHVCADRKKTRPMNCSSRSSLKRKSRSSFGANSSKHMREKNQSRWSVSAALGSTRSIWKSWSLTCRGTWGRTRSLLSYIWQGGSDAWWAESSALRLRWKCGTSSLVALKKEWSVQW